MAKLHRYLTNLVNWTLQPDCEESLPNTAWSVYLIVTYILEYRVGQKNLAYFKSFL